ncbi:MAG: hypothetical protein ABSC46_07560 [Candidatus Limnocylindrales bacterium]
MLGNRTRDARRTERYLDGLMAADERRASDGPVDTDLDPAIYVAAQALRSGLVRVHPSFRFEESLSARLAAGALRLRSGLPVDAEAVIVPGTVASFRGRSFTPAEEPAAAPVSEPAASTTPPVHSRTIWPAAAFRRFPDMTARPSRPLIVGGVGVASAAISIGAVYVAWRHSHPAASRMGRAARTAHGRTGHSGHGRRSGVINGILGVVS